MKKILFILHYPPPMHGAAMVGQYIRQSRRINDFFECEYINLGTSVRLDEKGKGSFKKWLRYIKILWTTFLKIIRFRPHLIYLTLTASGKGFYKDAGVVLLAKLVGGKVVFHFHNKGVHENQHRFPDDLLYKMVFRKAEVILLSELLYSDIQKYVPAQRIHYCQNGIPGILEKITKSPARKSSKVQLLFLSNLIVSKGVYNLLEACKLLQAKQLHFHCLFIGGEGDITSKQFYNKTEALGISEYVHYAGRKYGAKKAAAYKNADIFVLNTANDCFPLVVLEAMQFSLPVVSTWVGGIPNIVEDEKTGFLVAPEDPEMLAEKLEILIKDKTLREQMGSAGRHRYERDFTMEVFEERFSNIIKKIV
jgi:glycosyltransferase involved in cell wall biosynthesis